MSETRARKADERSREDAIHAAVRGLAEELGTKVAFVCEVPENDPEYARTLALSVDGDFLENREYRVAGTPCAGVYKGGRLFHPKGVAQIYPEDRMLAEWRLESYLGVGLYDAAGRLMGHVGVMHDGTLEDVSRSEARLRSVALAIGAELERRRARA